MKNLRGTTFNSFNLDYRILKVMNYYPYMFHERYFEVLRVAQMAVKLLGWKKPTLIQEKFIPLALQGKDIVSRARTGSGKTAAFSIPIIQKILEEKQSSGMQCIRAVVLAPSRELAKQLCDHINSLCQFLTPEIQCVDLVIAEHAVAQRFSLNSNPDIVVSTPSRLLAQLKQNNLSLRETLKYFVVDEADLVLSYGYESEITEIISYLPNNYQAFLTSATMNENVKLLKKLTLHNAVILKIEEAQLPAADQLTQYHIRCHIVQQFNSGLYDTIIASDEISVESPEERKQSGTIIKLEKKESTASRGIDFNQISNVINFDFPKTVEEYIHRVGRTARAWNQGTALSFSTKREAKFVSRVKKALAKQYEGEFLKPYRINMEELDGFHYRCLDALRAATTLAVKEARLKEIREEVLKSTKLKSYFVENPRDLQLIRHDRIFKRNRSLKHLKHVPEYIVPKSLRGVPVKSVQNDDDDDSVEHEEKDHLKSSDRITKPSLLQRKRKAYRERCAAKRKADPLESFNFCYNIISSIFLFFNKPICEYIGEKSVVVIVVVDFVELKMAPKIQYLRFNDSQGEVSNYFICALNTGLRVYNTDPFMEVIHLDEATAGSVKLCCLLQRSNIVALVCNGPNGKFSENSVVIWDDKKRKFILEIECPSEVVAVRMSAANLIIVLLSEVHVYTFPGQPNLIASFDTRDNPKGICSMNSDPEVEYFAFPGHRIGTLLLLNLKQLTQSESTSPLSIKAHSSDIACISLNNAANLVATASEKGTLIRIFNVQKKMKILEFRRGSDPALIYSIKFSLDSSFLCTTSDKGTIHIFSVKDPNLNQRSTLQKVGISGAYAESQWALAKFSVGSKYPCYCCFGKESTVIAVCMDGSYYKLGYDDSGTCTQLEYEFFLGTTEDTNFWASYKEE
ncbi:putative ATP-dependent RNA helicase DDX56 [Trichinella spiralis]|uniref:putative ATP-dependent RNA helicase DDX56 n=1 Tax=Trichinella spiralis TaxID=6334 RepID=UPI0001EFD0BB|nr:putative ATP-dependent RNA helicase DDX56 [Trichinella spiralis]